MTAPKASSTASPLSGVRTALLAAGVLAVFWAQYAWVRPTNFGGYDDWLILSLSSQGVTSVPYTGRPLSMLWTLAGPLVERDSLLGYFVAHGLYLSLAGVVALLLCLRLWPAEPAFAFVSACMAVSWIPLDSTRLQTVGMLAGAGSTFATMLAVYLLAEAHRRRSVLLLAPACALAFVILRGSEAVAAVLVAAPLLLLALPGSDRSRLRYEAAAWESAVGFGVLLIAATVFASPKGSYQTSGLGFDPSPLRVAERLLLQLGFHLGPLASPALSELAVTAAPLAAAAVLLTAWAAIPGALWHADVGTSRGEWLARMAAGLLWAVLGYSVFVLGRRNVNPSRTQLLAAPGIALFLASTAGLTASFVRGGARRLLLVLCGALVVALGAGRTVAMQREWDEVTAFPAQSRSLRELTTRAPDLEPNTLVVLVESAAVWPATFTFWHAVRYLYDGRAVGFVHDANAFLYPCWFLPEVVVCEPWPVVRGPWRSPVTRHRYEELLVARSAPDGSLAVLEEWPSTILPPLPPGVRYDPAARVRTGGPLPHARHILARQAPAAARAAELQ